MRDENAYFQHKDAQKYTWYRYRQDRVDKSVIDISLRKNMIGSVHDVRHLTGLGEELIISYDSNVHQMVWHKMRKQVEKLRNESKT